MDWLLEIVKIIIPAAIVFVTAFYLVKFFLDNESKKRAMEYKANSQNLVTPLRLQAYERIILLLERISPHSLVTRLSRPGITASSMQSELIKTIKAEFEHNLAQQIYISSPAWGLVRNAKEEIIKLVNISASQLDSRASGTDLSQKIIELTGQVQKLPTQVAIDYIKKEISQIF
jgi:hypothetical protein